LKLSGPLEVHDAKKASSIAKVRQNRNFKDGNYNFELTNLLKNKAELLSERVTISFFANKTVITKIF